MTLRRTSLAPTGFDARFSAVWRRYAYRISDDRTGYDPLQRERTTHVRGTLDVDAMNAAARYGVRTACPPQYRWGQEAILRSAVREEAELMELRRKARPKRHAI